MMRPARSARSPRAEGRAGDGIHIRALQTDAELRQCVELQRATWGADFDDIVPPSVLKVAQKIGGVVAGAFAIDGRLLGFVFGMAGVRGGDIIHWSDMLAVHEDARDRGIGQRLKDFQRTAARASGATTMYWSYDPLVARNAHMNFNRLGVRVDEYIEDMYGPSTSTLHLGLGTDRLIVAWSLAATSAPSPNVSEDEVEADSVVLNPAGRAVALVGSRSSGAARPALVRIEIPLDIVRVRDGSPADATEWRASTRAAFQWALANRYAVRRFVSDRAGDRGYYVLARLTGASA